MEHRNALRYVIEGSFCSFRDPLAAKYQPTFWLPPKTTVIGFLGCALGLAPPELEPLYDRLHVGVILLWWGGIARDLWCFTKLKGAAKPETAVLVRELIYRPQYLVYIAGDNVGWLEDLREALLDPVYPLRFGRGEDLAMLQGKPQLVSLSQTNQTLWLRWTLLPFTSNTGSYALERLDTDTRPRMPPRPCRMPVRFRYDEDRVRETDTVAMTQVFDWAVLPDSTGGLWSDGEHGFYLI